jgi:hypothetical protein
MDMRAEVFGVNVVLASGAILPPTHQPNQKGALK